MVLDTEFPDRRVEKEAKTLIHEGHDVSVICYSSPGENKKKGNYKGINLIKFKLNRSIRNKLYTLYLIFPVYKLIWQYHIEKTLKKNPYDALHIHDLPLSSIGVKMKKKYGIKLICDQHEYYSNWIVQAAHYNTFIGRIIKSMSNWKKYERNNLRLADLIVTIEEPLKKEYINKIGIKPNKIITLPNTPRNYIFNENNIDQNIIEKYKNNFVLFYAGGIDILRGIDIILNSLPKLKEKIPEIKFVMAGRILRKYDPIGMAKKLGVSDVVDYIGYLPIEQLPSYMAASKIGVFTPPVNREEINKTIATKIYQYARMGIPIITSKAKMMKEFVEKNEIGFSIETMEEFIQIILFLYNNPRAYKKMSENSYRTGKKYIWEETSLRLVDAYKKLM